MPIRSDEAKRQVYPKGKGPRHHPLPSSEIDEVWHGNRPNHTGRKKQSRVSRRSRDTLLPISHATCCQSTTCGINALITTLGGCSIALLVLLLLLLSLGDGIAPLIPLPSSPPLSFDAAYSARLSSAPATPPIVHFAQAALSSPSPPSPPVPLPVSPSPTNKPPPSPARPTPPIRVQPPPPRPRVQSPPPPSVQPLQVLPPPYAKLSEDTVVRLNARFRMGQPSNNLNEAGVVVRVLDSEEDINQPWKAGAGSFSDRFSVSIVNARHPDIYQGAFGAQTKLPGFVLSPSVQHRISCGYPKDGQTASMQCRTPGGDDGCKPGCARNVCGDGRRWNCHWPADQIKELMEAQDRYYGPFGHRSYSHEVYNEIILDTFRKPWDNDLPGAIEAIFVQATAPDVAKARAARIHESFLNAYHLDGRDVPLLLFDETSTETPFSRFASPPPPPPLIEGGSTKYEIVDTLNARYLHAHASNDLRLAGVIVRAWDGLSAPGRPWEPCEENQFCARYRDRFATSIIYPGHPETYASGGFILRPEMMDLNCAYSADGGSQGVHCDPPRKTPECSPGCKRWCEPSRGVKNWGCAWHPQNLKEMIEQQKILSPAGGYNEVILDAEAWVRNLPQSIMAVFVHKNAKLADVENSRSVHANFLQRYGLTSDATPLVTYDIEAAQGDVDVSPFALLD